MSDDATVEMRRWLGWKPPNWIEAGGLNELFKTRRTRRSSANPAETCRPPDETTLELVKAVYAGQLHARLEPTGTLTFKGRAVSCRVPDE